MSDETENGEINRPSHDRIFELLSNSRRRHLVRTLRESSPASIADLTNAVSEIEYGKPIEEISSDERHTIYVSIQQTHADALKNSGIIVDKGDRGEELTLGPNADRMMRWIDQLDEEQNGKAGMIGESVVTELIEQEVSEQVGEWRDGYQQGFADGFEEGKDE